MNFSWAHEVGFFMKEEEDPDTVWSRALADDVWTGAITPLMFSDRGVSWVADYRDAALPMLPDPELAKARVMKYFEDEAYENTAVEKAFMRWAPPVSRAGMAARIPVDMHADALAQPFSWFDYAKVMARARVAYGKNGSPYGWMRYLDDCFANRVEEANGHDVETLRGMSDAAIKRYITRQWDFEHEYNVALIWPGMSYCVRDFMVSLNLILQNLTRPEFYAVVDGTYNPVLTKAKIDGRMRNFERFKRRDWAPPKFLKRNRPYAEATSELGTDGLLVDLPTSSGTVTGTARVVRAVPDWPGAAR